VWYRLFTFFKNKLQTPGATQKIRFEALGAFSYIKNEKWDLPPF
jgi:hypothetical protein